VAAAADLADDVGWERLTLAALAERVGVAVPSLYKHVDGLDAVRRGVTVLAVTELGETLAAAAGSEPGRGADPSAQLHALAAAYRSYAVAHPGRYAATVRAARPDDEAHVAASDAVLATVLSALADRGLRGDDATDAARTIRASLHGFVVLEAAGGFGLPRDVDRSFERLVHVIDRGLDTVGGGRRGPNSQSRRRSAPAADAMDPPRWARMRPPEAGSARPMPPGPARGPGASSRPTRCPRSERG
jgi:AcrR family transcriptional regulator